MQKNARSTRRNFNPRSPHGERRSRCRFSARYWHFNPRSPHGERRIATSFCATADRFQSTLPARGATFLTLMVVQHPADFNPRSPHGERHWCDSGALWHWRISIHAPRTGSDWATSSGCLTSTDFNPRSPHGERRYFAWFAGTSSTFQSTLPARGATILALRSASPLPISIHAPRTGSDLPTKL